MLAPESHGEKKAWLPCSAIALSLAPERPLGFLMSETMATADLVSSPQDVGSNKFDLFCVCAFV